LGADGQKERKHTRVRTVAHYARITDGVSDTRLFVLRAMNW
jgi:hypothetical protein